MNPFEKGKSTLSCLSLLYERTEILSLLEMALWKMKNDEWKLVISRHQDCELTGDVDKKVGSTVAT
jgi:hypothetical protein